MPIPFKEDREIQKPAGQPKRTNNSTMPDSKTAAPTSDTPTPQKKKRALSPIQFCLLLYGLPLFALVALHFPYATDPQQSAHKTVSNEDASRFYKQVYAEPVSLKDQQQEPAAAPAADDPYVIAEKAWRDLSHPELDIQDFVKQHNLADKRVLEVGSGTGYLQDIVADYTGLDISPSARRHYHKPFVAASATDMPFADGTFDAIWTINVLEHVPNPESALNEMRRVLKPGGVLFLYPAWQVPAWAAQGYEARPYSDFNLWGKLVKSSVALRKSMIFQTLHIVPTRLLRYGWTRLDSGPTAFHYRRLTANYDHYWVPDADAVNSLDPYEAALWFESRGDRCLNCPSGFDGVLGVPGKLIIQVNPAGRATAGAATHSD